MIYERGLWRVVCYQLSKRRYELVIKDTRLLSSMENILVNKNDNKTLIMKTPSKEDAYLTNVSMQLEPQQMSVCS